MNCVLARLQMKIHGYREWEGREKEVCCETRPEKVCGSDPSMKWPKPLCKWAALSEHITYDQSLVALYTSLDITWVKIACVVHNLWRRLWKIAGGGGQGAEWMGYSVVSVCYIGVCSLLTGRRFPIIHWATAVVQEQLRWLRRPPSFLISQGSCCHCTRRESKSDTSLTDVHSAGLTKFKRISFTTYLFYQWDSVPAPPSTSGNNLSHFPCVFAHYSESSSLMAGIQTSEFWYYDWKVIHFTVTRMT